MPDVLEPPTQPKPKPLPNFCNPEAARKAGLRSQALAKAKRESLEARLAACSTPQPAVQPSPQTAPLDDFAARRLIRVREQLDRLDALASVETDPKQLKELADASARLSAQEFDLAGRPKSGTTKPDNKPKRTTGQSTAPAWQVEQAPALAQAQPVTQASAQPEPMPVTSTAPPDGHEYINETGVNASVEQ